MTGTGQQSTGNSYLLPCEAGKNVWIVVGSDSDETTRLQRSEAMAVVNNKYMCTFFLRVYVKEYKYFFKYPTYDRWGRKSNLSHWTFIIILIRLSAVFRIYYLWSFVFCLPRGYRFWLSSYRFIERIWWNVNSL